MSDYLPEEILHDIFIRLPRRSLMRFRCVCKYFCVLFGSRGFQNMHHELSNIKNGTAIMLHDIVRKESYRIDYKSVSSLLPLSTSSSTSACEFIIQMDYPSIFHNREEVECLSSHDGLAWIRLYKGIHSYLDIFEEDYIWNPTTNRCKEIPIVPGINTNIGYGFCYDYKVNDYKLVTVVVDRVSKCSNVYVYMLGLNSWERTQSIPYYLHNTHANEGVLFNGALHWLECTIGDNSTVLVRMDIVNERFQEVALPESYPEEPLERVFDTSVRVLGGCLCLIFWVVDVHVDVWIMEDYGAKESWTKSYTITQKSIISTVKNLKLVWSFKNNETLWEVDGGLVLYDPNNKKHRELVLDIDFQVIIDGRTCLLSENAGL